MRERPILFKGDMVRAILDGRKTQTRRLLGLPEDWSVIDPDINQPVLGMITSKHPKQGKFGVFITKESNGFRERDIVVCPYGKPGDRIWVRENYRPYVDENGVSTIQYQADLSQIEIENTEEAANRWMDLRRPEEQWPEMREPKWRPSIHMPRLASRITLEIVSVRVERLQDISEEDAKAEGVVGEQEAAAAGLEWYDKPRRAFLFLWQSINGPESWDANPWVWVVEFKRVSA